jgi:hypothetical protein
MADLPSAPQAAVLASQELRSFFLLLLLFFQQKKVESPRIFDPPSTDSYVRRIVLAGESNIDVLLKSAREASL